MPKEAGYAELRVLFDYLRSVGQVGPHACGKEQHANGTNGSNGVANGTEKVEICLIDADDMLDAPYAMIEKYCGSVGIEYTPDMLKWDSEKDQVFAKKQFEKWTGFHEDAIDSTELRPRTHVSLQSFIRCNISILTSAAEKDAQIRRGALRGVDGKVWRGGGQGDQTDCGGQRGRLRVLEAIRYQGLKD
jgi:hypothetical protein